MKVTFTRTGEHRYRVSVEGAGIASSWMEPAPGYDSRLPHDTAHFVVENELGINGGIFGQLAAGGHARTFNPTGTGQKRKVAKRGARIAAANRKDSILSERLVYIACQIWNSARPAVSEVEGVSLDDINRVCREFDRVSAIWSTLTIGESMTLDWHGTASGRGRGRAAIRRSEKRRSQGIKRCDTRFS